MTTFSLAPMVFSRLSGLESIPIQHAPEAATMSWKQGALLIYDVSSVNRIKEAGADPAVVQGVAMVAASGTTDKDVPFIVPAPGVLFEVSMDESGLQGVYVLAASDRGKQYGAAKDSTTGFWYLDQDETSVKVFEIVDFVSAVGDITPRVIVKFTLTAME